MRNLSTEIYTMIDTDFKDDILTISFNETLFQDYKGEKWNEYFNLSISFIIKDNNISYKSEKHSKKEKNMMSIHEDMILLSKEIINYSFHKFYKFMKELYDLYTEEHMANIDVSRDEFIEYIKSNFNEQSINEH